MPAPTSVHPKLLAASLTLPKVLFGPPTAEEYYDVPLSAISKLDLDYFARLAADTTGKWCMYATDIDESAKGALADLDCSWALFSFNAGYQMKSGAVSDWHVPDKQLAALFADLPVFSWNDAESLHSVSADEFKTFLGSKITLANIRALYTIVHYRLLASGVHPSRVEDPYFDIKDLQAAAGKKPTTVIPPTPSTSASSVASTSSVLLPFISPDVYTDPETEDCKKFLAFTLLTFAAMGHNSSNKGVDAKGWKRLSKSKSSAGIVQRVFSHTSGLEATVAEQRSASTGSVRLALVQLSGLPLTGTAADTLSSEDFL